MEDPIERTFEYSGIFENDYLEGCKLQNIPPFQISKIGIDKSSYLSRSPSNAKVFGTKKSNPALDLTLEQNTTILSNSESRFKFAKKINIFTDDEDEVVGLKIRGWKIPLPMTDILVNSILASPTVAVLNLWNCGLNDAQANSLLQVSNSNIRELFIDQNPGVSEILFAGFISEESNVKTLSARSNNIGDAGAKAIAAALKINRSLTILNLWDNRIRRDGAEAIADGNQCLLSLSLGKNYVDDAAASAFAKGLSLDEVQIRRKVIAEWEKRRELEDKQRKGAVAAAIAAPKTGMKGKDDPKKTLPLAAKGRPAENLRVQNLKAPKISEKKSAIDEKLKAKDGKKTNTAGTPLKGQRKLSIPEDFDPTPAAYSQEPQPYPEPMYEINGQWYILGNRTIINLDFSSNEITDIGLHALLDAVSIQEMTNEAATSSDGLNGLYRLSLYENKFESNNAAATALDGLLKKRNPFYESMEEASISEDVIPEDGLKVSAV